MAELLVIRLQHPITYLLYVIVLCAVVFFTSIQPPYIFLTPDSFFYLDEAKQIAQKGLVQGVIDSDFTKWPIGYPFSIALIMNLFNLSALVASKWVNVFFLTGCLFILWLQFNKQAILYAFLFSHALVVTLFRYTWSESGFIFFELLTFYSAQQLIVSKGLKAGVYLLIGCCGILMMRYSGIFIFPWLLWLIFQYHIRYGLLNLRIFSVFVLVILVEVIYGIHNIRVSSFWFGGLRPQDTNGMMLNLFLLFRALLQQLSFIVHAKSIYSFIPALFLQLLIIRVVSQRMHMTKEFLHPLLSSQVWFSGAFFSCMCIVILRFFVSFDDFNYRLLLPGLLPGAIVMLNQLILKHNKYYSKAILVLMLFSILSLGSTVFYPNF